MNDLMTEIDALRSENAELRRRLSIACREYIRLKNEHQKLIDECDLDYRLMRERIDKAEDRLKQQRVSHRREINTLLEEAHGHEIIISAVSVLCGFMVSGIVLMIIARF